MIDSTSLEWCWIDKGLKCLSINQMGTWMMCRMMNKSGHENQSILLMAQKSGDHHGTDVSNPSSNSGINIDQLPKSSTGDCQNPATNQYSPWKRTNVRWKIVVGRWNFLLGWFVFKGTFVSCRWCGILSLFLTSKRWDVLLTSGRFSCQISGCFINFFIRWTRLFFGGSEPHVKSSGRKMSGEEILVWETQMGWR